LAAQNVALSLCKPGANLPSLHAAATEVIGQGLIDLGLIKEGLDEALEAGVVKRFFPHGLSHWIGMDVHDLGPDYDESEPVGLAPGMYFSVEPGIYIQPDDETVAADWRGIGIRVEDDVLITQEGSEVLTAAIAKEVSVLENRA